MTDKYLQIPELMDIAKFVYSIPYFFRKQFGSPSFFKFNNREYTYFAHPYNGTWMNERAIEIPIIWEQVSLHPPQTVLEVGNVLSHYFPISHIVVDKYERSSGVIASDILDFDLPKKFDCIVSISTLEHVGWDEIPRVSGKHLLAIKKMRGFLSSNGKMFVTIPLGYNPAFDADIFSEKLGCTQTIYFKRIRNTEWREASKEEVRDSSYGKKFRTTDGLAFCVWKG